MYSESQFKSQTKKDCALYPLHCTLSQIEYITSAFTGEFSRYTLCTMLIGFDASRAFVDEATGTENYSLNLLKSLAKIDRENRYRVYLRESAQGIVKSVQSEEDLSLYTNHLSLPNNFEFKIIRPSRLWTQVGLALETWKNPVDLLFVPAHTLPILRNPKIKTVVTIHDLGVEYLPGHHQFPQRYYLDFASRYAATHADGIIAVSAATGADLVKRYGVLGKKISVVHEGVDRGFFKPQSKVKVENVKSKYKIESPYVLFVGTIQPRKNLQMLIKAFSLLVGSGEWVVGSKDKKTTNYQLSTINLIIAGKLGWDYQPILDAPKKYGVEDKVKFIGRVPDEDLPALYTGASVFAFPSLFEGFGLPILEAMACGCPVIASDIAPHREIMVGDSDFASKKLLTTNYQLQTSDSARIAEANILAKVDDPDQWAQFLYQSITKNDLRSALVSYGNSRLDSFSWDKAAKDALGVFERVLE